jgi:lipopolysaccharide export LptBFGC system permease protein LptF
MRTKLCALTLLILNQLVHAEGDVEKFFKKLNKRAGEKVEQGKDHIGDKVADAIKKLEKQAKYEKDKALEKVNTKIQEEKTVVQGEIEKVKGSNIKVVKVTNKDNTVTGLIIKSNLERTQPVHFDFASATIRNIEASQKLSDVLENKIDPLSPKDAAQIIYGHLNAYAGANSNNLRSKVDDLIADIFNKINKEMVTPKSEIGAVDESLLEEKKVDEPRDSKSEDQSHGVKAEKEDFSDK